MSTASLPIQSGPGPSAGNHVSGKGRNGTEKASAFNELMDTTPDSAPRVKARQKADRGGETVTPAPHRWTISRAREGAPDKNLATTAEPPATAADEPDAVEIDPVAALLSTVAPPKVETAPRVKPDAAAPPVVDSGSESERESAPEAEMPDAAAPLVSLLASREARDPAPSPVPAEAAIAATAERPQHASGKAPAPAAPSTVASAAAETPADSGGDIPESVARPVARADDQSAAQSGGRRASPGDDTGAAPLKVTVASVQFAPAPATPVQAPSPTGAALVASLQAEGTLASYASEQTLANPQPAEAKPVTILRLQLQPVELGNVTVKISGTGEEIAIEVQVENSEARHRLSSDSDAIVKSLRGLGYEVERLTIQMVTPTTGAGQQQSATGGRSDGFAAFEQRGGERGGGQQNHSTPGGGADDNERAAPQPDRVRAAGSVYI